MQCVGRPRKWQDVHRSGAAKKIMEKDTAEGGLNRCEMFGYADHNALDVLPLLLVGLLQANEGILGGEGEGEMTARCLIPVTHLVTFDLTYACWSFMEPMSPPRYQP